MRCPHDRRAVPVQGSYDVTAMCLRATGLQFFFKFVIVPRQCLGYICLTTRIGCLYDVQITVSVRSPQGDLSVIVRIYGHRGLYDFV